MKHLASLLATTFSLLASIVGCGTAVTTPDGNGGGGSSSTPTASSTSSGIHNKPVPKGSCHDMSECSGAPNDSCVLAGTPNCNTETCDTTLACSGDSDCVSADSVAICASDVCGCSSCQAGCTSDADCGVARVCNVVHRCVPAPCVTNPTCPPDFACVETQCDPKPCTSDADCNGYCVQGACRAEPGYCMGI